MRQTEASSSDSGAQVLRQGGAAGPSRSAFKPDSCPANDAEQIGSIGGESPDRSHIAGGSGSLSATDVDSICGLSFENQGSEYPGSGIYDRPPK
jgi:hypothetical protein